ncbi:MAG TPA: bacillithiol biosynthesis cysteine-adding enzyme BshC [Bryobacteraceae bacterium]|nr:bacillithiol biosynthesis cysteine-adding enzyme BshC [Bryobacteraceae bacterium]
MEPACLRHTELPHTSRLFSDFLYHYHRVERFYTAPPSTGYPEERRPAMVAALRAQNGDHPSLEILSRPGAVTVVTGQQVGLFSGPAYTLYKALTAARLAEQLSQRGTPAVPVFWLATEDHDFAEVNHAWSFDRATRPVRLQVNGQNGGGRPVGSIAVDEWPVAQFRASVSDLPFGDEVATLIEETYVPGATMGEAFHRLLSKLLKPYGFLFLDPLHPTTRQLAAPMLKRAVSVGPDLNKLLLQRNRELEAAGYHAQVHVEPGTSLFFLLEGGKRVPARELKYSPEQLAERAEQLSPNALLRPVVQDYMLPTAAYIGGPAELAYFAQSQVLYERLLGHMPRLVSRSGFTLFDARSAKLMERYGLRPKDFFHGQEPLQEQIASRLVPEGLERQFEDVTSATEQNLDKLQRAISAYDPTLGDAVQKSRSKMLHQLTKMRAKVARETLRRNERSRDEAHYLYHTVYPEKHLQERFYSILPFLARHGVELIDQLYDSVKLDCPDHILLQV